MLLCVFRVKTTWISMKTTKNLYHKRVQTLAWETLVCLKSEILPENCPGNFYKEAGSTLLVSAPMKFLSS